MYLLKIYYIYSYNNLYLYDLFKARLLATSFSFKLGNLLTLRGLTELDLPAKAAGLRKSAEDCADKNEDSTGPPSYLMK